MSGMAALLRRCPVADDALHDDHRRPASFGLERLQCGGQRVHVVGVVDVLDGRSQQAQSIKIFTTTRLAVTDVELSAPATELLSG